MPLVVAGLVGLGYALGLGGWGRVWNLALAGGVAGWIAWTLRGRWRDSAVSLAAILFALAGIEAMAIALQTRPIDRNTAGYSVSHPVLGWAPGAPGTYHHVKRRADGTLIFAARYTIGPDRERVVDAAEAGAPVVFLGDSMTFGTGVADAETLPQLFADAVGRRLPVRNLAMSGYGPQQVLRALDRASDDPRLIGARAFVFQTAAFHAERSSCWASFMLRAPRYVLVDGVPTHKGPCYGNWWVAARSLFIASATYHQFVAPILGKPTRAEIDLYIAMLIEAGKRASRYNAPLIILYLPRPGDYLSRAGMTEADIMDRLRAGGLTVVDGSLDPQDFLGQPLAIPGDGHPTGTANRARARLLARALRP